MARAINTLPVDFPEPTFRTVDGEVEIRVAEAAEAPMSRPRRVTAIIAAMCERFGNDPVDEDQVRRVSAAGREWLLQQSALKFYRGTSWFEAPCPTCGQRFDLELSLEAIPRGAAGTGFPEVEVCTSLGPRRFEAPNGLHEERMAAQQGDDPRRVFAALCGLADDAANEVDRFADEDLERIDSALELISPGIADAVNVACPDCGASTRVRIDPLTFAFPHSETVLRDVHLIAGAYGWSEADILAMPSQRRRAYAAIIRANAASPANRAAVQ